MSKIGEKKEENNKKIKKIQEENIRLDSIAAANAAWILAIEEKIDEVPTIAECTSEESLKKNSAILKVLQELKDTDISLYLFDEEGE